MATDGLRFRRRDAGAIDEAELKLRSYVDSSLAPMRYSDQQSGGDSAGSYGIGAWYNPRPRHTSIDNLSPAGLRAAVHSGDRCGMV